MKLQWGWMTWTVLNVRKIEHNELPNEWTTKKKKEEEIVQCKK